MLYLHKNGVTVIAKEEAKRGKVYDFNGEEYYVARSVADIKRIIESGEYPLNRVVTSKLKSLNSLFQIRAGGVKTTWDKSKGLTTVNTSLPANFNDDITNWDTSNVLSMEEMFSGWPTFNQDISNWDTSMVESMHGMFKGSKYKGSYYLGDTSFNQDISKWNVSNVKNMSEMFLGATSFNQNLNGWDVGNVENMDYMFSGATSFNQDLSNWDVSNVSSMKGMFSDVVAIGNAGSYDTHDFEYTRAGFTSFNQPIGNWDVSNVKDMSHMFSGATSFNQDIGYWDVSNVRNMSYMFSGGIIDSNQCAYGQYFLKSHRYGGGDNNPTSFNQDISNWDVSNVDIMTGMFSSATSFNQPIENWNVSKVRSMAYMFSGAKSFNQPLGNWDVRNLIRIGYMFRGAISFNQPIGNWDVSNVRNMSHMFSGAISFNQDLNGWGKLSGFNGMFYGATSFNSPIGKCKLSSTSTGHITSSTSMENMFREATSFNQDISSWDVSNVTQMKGLFQDATSFNQDLRSWKLNEKLPKSRTMFKGATAFNIKEYSPFLNIKPKERKVDTSTADLSSEDKRTYSKIKKLIVSRDIDKIDMGIELALSLNNASVFNSLLAGCKLTQGEKQSHFQSFFNPNRYSSNSNNPTSLVTNKLFTGTGPAQPFLNYALLSLIANFPENDDIEIDESIKIKNITEFHLSEGEMWNRYSIPVCKAPDISKFSNLKSLIVSDSIPIQSTSSSVTKLKLIDFSGSLKFLEGFKQLEHITLSISTWGGQVEVNKAKSLDSFKHLASLRELRLNPGGKLADINFLSECIKLEKLSLTVSGSYWKQDEKVMDISVLSGLKNLQELSLFEIHKDLDISSIGNCKNLKNLDLTFQREAIFSVKEKDNVWRQKTVKLDIIMPDLSMLNSLNELSVLNILGCGPYNFNSKIENINEIKLPKNLVSIKVNNIGIAMTKTDVISVANANQKIEPISPILDKEEQLPEKQIISKNNVKSEDKKTLTKIKSLLTTRDFDKIEMGIELLRSINIIEFYEILLAGCKIVNEADRQDLTYNKFFTGSGPAQPYLDYALYLLIHYCPDEVEVDDSIRKKNINKLKTTTFFNNNQVKYRLPPIENFTSLQELNIDLSSFDLDYSKPEDVLKNSSVVKMRIEGIASMWLKNFPQLEYISADSDEAETKDLHVFEYLTNLEELEISCSHSKNVDFLKNCVKLKKLHLNLFNVQDINALKDLIKLEELEIKVGKNAGAKVLTTLKSSSSLEKLVLKSEDQFNIKLSTSNFYGLNKFDKLKSLTLDGAKIKF